MVPNKGEQNWKCLPHPCLLGCPKEGGMLRHPCILGDPQHKGTKLKVATSPLPSQGPKRGRKMLHHTCILGDPQRQAREAKLAVVPNKGEQNQKCLPHPCLLGAQKRAEMLCRPCILGGPRTRVQKGPSSDERKKAPQSGGQDHKSPTGGPKVLKPGPFFFVEVLKPSEKQVFPPRF